MSSKPQNASQLRDAIDSGETRDKVDFPDPAAAPLGTDAEAAGNAAIPAGSAETRRIPAPKGHRIDGFLLYLGAAIVVVAAFSGVTLLAAA